MACIQSKRIEDFEKMPKNIRNMLTPPRATTQRDQQPQMQQPVVSQPSVIDENTIRAQVIAEQKNALMVLTTSLRCLVVNTPNCRRSV
jgi:hypothetical protein